ncbi:MAG: FAD:protein FMN transferase [Clostridiales bacterium]|nr:FAD:protein FMN transferase [Clostridiales bacterium]
MEKIFYAFGTVNYIRIEEELTEDKMDDIIKMALLLDDQLSVFKPESEVARINENAGKKPVKVAPNLIFLLKKASYYSQVSQGAFDITIKPAVKLWNIGHKEQRIPTDTELDALKTIVDYKSVVIDETEGTVYLEKCGQSIDLGGIAKGYAQDLIKQELITVGVTSGILNFGGSIMTIGKKKDGGSWNIGIQDPLNKRGNSIGTIRLKDEALVTSAVNERFFKKQGITYHHILDPNTLRPAQSGVLSVTAVGNSGMELDALTTALFVMGMKNGIDLANQLGIDVLYLLENGEMYGTNGFISRDFILTTNNKNSGRIVG